MDPNQILRSSEHWSTEHNYRRRTAISSLPSNRRGGPGDSRSSDSSTMRTTRTGTYGLGISPPPSPPGETETTTPGGNLQTEHPGAYRLRGTFGIPTPSTSWTGINPWPLSSSLSTYCPHTDAAPRLGRAPWPALADVLEDRTLSPSPPPVELSVYHPLQTTNPHRPPTPTPSSTGTSPSRFESAPTSPKISRPGSPTTTILERISQPPAISSSSILEEKRTYSTSTAPTLSGPNSPKLTERSWEWRGPLPGSGDDMTSRIGA